MLKEVVRDQTPQVESPKRKAEARALAKNPIDIGGGHHMKTTQSNKPGSTARPQHNTNTDTESETESNANTDTEPEIDTEPKIETYKIANALRRKQAIYSPSPLPNSHVPIDPDIIHQLELPINHVRETLALGFTFFISTIGGSDTTSIFGRDSNSDSKRPSHLHASGRSQLDLGTLRPRCNPGQSLCPLDERRGLAKGAAKALRQQHTVQAPGSSNHASGSHLPSGTVSPDEFVREHYRAQREHRAQTSTSDGSNNPESGRRASSPDLMPDDEEEQVAIAARASGLEPKRGRKKKPAARDIHGNERYILTIAKQHLFAYALSKGAWQNRALFTRWTPPIYIETWNQELPDVPVKPPSPEAIQIMVNSLATAHGKVKDLLRPFTQYTFGFEKPALNAEAINRNLAIFRDIHPNQFHCLEYQPPYGHYESNALSQAIAMALFSNPSSVGVTFQNYFNPMPLTTTAFVLANVQVCIEEYEHGQFEPRDLNATDMLNKYVAHLRGLKEACAGAKARLLRLQQEWFDYGFEYSGAMMTDDPSTQMITLRSEIRPDTPPADDEAEQPGDFLPEDASEESEVEDNGRYSKCVKGNGRA
ncbi:hypothetical protein FRC08_014014 [Ceratobasidium sp. 394]|nr:hypothetical protein FRC08_014014 [Ceratobasidium sp. 394]